MPWCGSMVIPYIGHHKALDETRKALSLHRTVTDLIFPHIRSNLSLFQIFSPTMCGCSLDLWMSRSFPRKPPHFILTSKFKKTTHHAQNASHDYHQATRDPRIPGGQWWAVFSQIYRRVKQLWMISSLYYRLIFSRILHWPHVRYLIYGQVGPPGIVDLILTGTIFIIATLQFEDTAPYIPKIAFQKFATKVFISSKS